MDQLASYVFGRKQLRVFGTAEQPLFLAKDVGKILGIKNIRDNLRTLDDDWKDDVGIPDTTGRVQKMTGIYEPGLYKLIFSSKTREAKAFTKWVCEVVLPSIRKTGKFEMEKRVKALEDRIAELETNSRRFVSEEDAGYKDLHERCIELGFIPEDEYREVYRKHPVKVKGRNSKGEHADYYKMRGRLVAISKRCTKAKLKIDGVKPPLSSESRRNKYTLEDYDKFADDVIRKYFFEHPYESWMIRAFYDENEPF